MTTGRALFLLVLLFTIYGCKKETVVAKSQYQFPSNPYGFWQTATPQGPLWEYSDSDTCVYSDTTNGLIFFNRYDVEGSRVPPYVSFNPTTITRVDNTNAWALKPGEVGLESSNSSNKDYAELWFNVAKAGTYKVTARFEGVHFRLATTDVHVLHNRNVLFDDSISGYGGDPAFHAIEGTRPEVTYTAMLELKQKDKLVFAVGYGSNNTNYNDVTGVLVDIEEVK